MVSNKWRKEWKLQCILEPNSVKLPQNDKRPIPRNNKMDIQKVEAGNSDADNPSSTFIVGLTKY